MRNYHEKLRVYVPRPARPYPLAAKLELALRGLRPLDVNWQGYTGYHRVQFTCGHTTTWSWAHIRNTDKPECPTCRNARRFS